MARFFITVAVVTFCICWTSLLISCERELIACRKEIQACRKEFSNHKEEK